MTSSTWQPKGAGIASLTQLPPSPEIKGRSYPNSVPFESLSLGEEQNPLFRLRSIVKYQAFQPQALACSSPVPSTFSENTDVARPKSVVPRRSVVHERSTSSLGAIAGAKGIAVFQVSKPHTPLLVLSHSSNTVSKEHKISSLAFSPETQSLYLAAARASAVLVWDVGGHSLSPFLGRVGTDATTGTESELITSLAWKPGKNTNDLLATTTAQGGFLWDLRFTSHTPKPCIRFGGRSKLNANYVQLAFSRSDECAIIDAAGTVQVFDIRMTERNRESVSTFTALRHAGIGIAYLPIDGKDTGWVTWGMDAPDTNAIVNIWSSTHRSKYKASQDDYWHIDTDPRRSHTNYNLIARCSSPCHLACPRVCPDPVENSFVTVSLQQNGVDFKVDLWKLRASETPPDTNGNVGLERIASFKEEPNEDKFILTNLGESSGLGRLCSAELAISSNSRLLPKLKHNENGRTGNATDDGNEGGVALVLCCLSDNGYVTTRVIPEAIPKEQPIPTDKYNTVSPVRQAPRNLLHNTQAKVYPNDNDSVRNDAARVWASRGDRNANRAEGRSIADIRNSQLLPKKTNDTNLKGQASSLIDDAAGTMLFDMDVPAVVYNSVAPNSIAGIPIGVGLKDLTSPVVSTSGVVVAEETDQTAPDARDIAAMMENIETDRIPCPRLCGATFSPGIGGLALFNNGDVRKIWYWYERADSNRLSGLPGIVTEPTSFEMGTAIHASSLNGKDEDSAKKVPRDHPRTLQDLIDMTAAAKEAQWGERNDSDASSADDVENTPGDNFFEYDSDGSNTSVSDDEQPAGLIDISEVKRSNEMYDSYFGNFQRLVSTRFQRLVPEPDSSENIEIFNKDEQLAHRGDDRSRIVSRKHTMPYLGPSSDMLAPMVSVAHHYDQLTLNGQSPQLAEAFELCNWNIGKSAQVSKKESANSMIVPTVTIEEQKTGSILSVNKSKVLSQSRMILPTHNLIESEALFDRSSKQILTVQTNKPKLDGGEYHDKSNRQESMVFLRKLYSHQQEGNNSYPALLSPPDSPFLPNNLPQIPTKRLKSKRRKSEELIDRSAGDRDRIYKGVYTLKIQELYSDTEGQDGFLRIKEHCLHYANACEDLNEIEKGGTWKFLAQMVDNRINDAMNPSLGCDRAGGGALGVDLVRNVFQYYESLGDVQMLATMVCVLSGGKRRIHQYAQPNTSLLPEGQDEKYDKYIHRYSDLLFGWRLLTIRAELNKYLVRSIALSEGDEILKIRDRTDTDRGSPGIAFVFTCQQCGIEADLQSNFCRSCQDYAFRCSICENGVRGLFTACDLCGHGGHVQHIISWFENHSECPSGCGCNCTYASMKTSTVDVGIALHSPLSKSLVC